MLKATDTSHHSRAQQGRMRTAISNSSRTVRHMKYLARGWSTSWPRVLGTPAYFIAGTDHGPAPAQWNAHSPDDPTHVTTSRNAQLASEHHAANARLLRHPTHVAHRQGWTAHSQNAKGDFTPAHQHRGVDDILGPAPRCPMLSPGPTEAGPASKGPKGPSQPWHRRSHIVPRRAQAGTQCTAVS